MSGFVKKWWVLVLAVMLPLAGWAYGEKPVPNPGAVLQVTDVTVTAVPTNKLASVAVLGTLKNTGDKDVENLVLEVKLTNAQGVVMDVLTEHQPELSIPAHDQIAFRVRGDGAALAASYAGAQVRVVSAKLTYDPTERPNPSSRVVSLLASLLIASPFVLLLLGLAVWIRKYNDKNSVGARTLEHIKSHQLHIVPLIERQTVALEQIAASLASRQPPESTNTHPGEVP